MYLFTSIKLESAIISDTNGVKRVQTNKGAVDAAARSWNLSSVAVKTPRHTTEPNRLTSGTRSRANHWMRGRSGHSGRQSRVTAQLVCCPARSVRWLKILSPSSCVVHCHTKSISIPGIIYCRGSTYVLLCRICSLRYWWTERRIFDMTWALVCKVWQFSFSR